MNILPDGYRIRFKFFLLPVTICGMRLQGRIPLIEKWTIVDDQHDGAWQIVGIWVDTNPKWKLEMSDDLETC